MGRGDKGVAPPRPLACTMLSSAPGTTDSRLISTERGIGMSGEEEQARPSQQPEGNGDYYAEFPREEWIAYLAGRETPAYAGWADNFSAVGERLNRQDAVNEKGEG